MLLNNCIVTLYYIRKKKNIRMNILITVIEFIKLNFTYIQFQNTVLATVAIIITCRELFIKIERENKKQKEREKKSFLNIT